MRMSPYRLKGNASAGVMPSNFWPVHDLSARIRSGFYSLWMLSDSEPLLPAIPLRMFLLTLQLLCFYNESCLRDVFLGSFDTLYVALFLVSSLLEEIVLLEQAAFRSLSMQIRT
jgi:hypothetical protein